MYLSPAFFGGIAMRIWQNRAPKGSAVFAVNENFIRYCPHISIDWRYAD
jgi:hypothetical protein